MLTVQEGVRRERRASSARAWLSRRADSATSPLALAGVAMIALAGIALVALIADPRVLTGAPLWLKPLKFAVSTAIYCFTLLWLLGFVQGYPRLVRLIAAGTAGLLVAEIGLIVFQAARGVMSHFNVGTAFDAFIYARMRDAIVGVAMLNLLTIILLLRQHLADRAFGAALRGGLGLTFAGMLTGVLMTLPLPYSKAVFTDSRAGAHSVGVADGGPGLPILGWSTTGGDLRIAHFAGLHAMQLLPLLAWALARPRFDWLGAGGRLALVRTAAWGYLGLIALLAWQAMRGQPLTAPDGATLVACGALFDAMALVALATVALARRRAA